MTGPNATHSDTAPSDGAGWIARLMSGEATADDHLACTQWRLLSAENEADYQRARSAWNAAGAAKASLRKAAPGWRAFGGMAAATALALIAAVVVLGPTLPLGGPQERTFVASADQKFAIELNYGADVALNLRSEISVSETRERTSVQLRRGEAFFSVEPGQERSFIVNAGKAVVTVTGTSFEVAHFQTNTLVAVEHGTVWVEAGQSPALSLRAGDRVLITAEGAVRPLSTIPPEIVGAWRDGQLIFVDEPLGLVFERLQLYTQGQITLAADVDAGLLVSATFADQDIDSVLSGLDETLPISIKETASGAIVVSPN